MIKLSEITINGFKSLNRRVRLKFSYEPISVIYGENGSGKTTVLKIIHGILDRDEDILLREKVRNVKLEYVEDEKLKKIYIYLQEDHNLESANDEDNKYNWDEFDKSSLSNCSSILFGVNRGITGRIDVNVHDILRYISINSSYRHLFNSGKMAMNFSRDLVKFIKEQNLQYKNESNIRSKDFDFNIKNLKVDDIKIEAIQNTIHKRYKLAKEITSQRVQKALFDTLSSAINPIKGGKNDDIDAEDFLNELRINKERLLEALNDSAENTLRNELITILNNNDLEEIMEYCFKSELLTDLLYRMMQELKDEGNILESLNILEDIFNSHLSNNKKLEITNKEVFIRLEDERHSINELSSGERHLLTFLTLFLIEGRDKNFLMIDEPELSLNIKWQREILPLLNTLAPNAQIIVASHSPSIAKKNTNYLVALN